MQLKDMEEVVGMMRVFYDSPAVIHAAPDEILRQDVKDCVGECPYIEGYIFEENDRILVLNSSIWFAILFQICRNNELICLLIVIRLLNCLYNIVCSHAFALYQRFISQFYTIPAVISVHSIVTSHDRNHFTDTDLFHLGFQLLYITFS